MLEHFALHNEAATPQKTTHRLADGRNSVVAECIVAENAQSSEEPIFTFDDEKVDDSVTVRLPIDEWTPGLEREFLNLVKVAALSTITAEQSGRLALLQTSRRALKYPRSAEDILREIQQRSATKQLLSALQKYVQVHDPANSPWAHAKENLHQGELPLRN